MKIYKFDNVWVLEVAEEFNGLKNETSPIDVVCSNGKVFANDFINKIKVELADKTWNIKN